MTLYSPGSPLAPLPSAYTMATAELAQLPLDTSNLLQVGETVTACTTTLTDVSQGRGLVVDLGMDPVIASPLITQEVSGSLLKVNHLYELAFVFTGSTGRVWEQVITIRVPR